MKNVIGILLIIFGVLICIGTLTTIVEITLEILNSSNDTYRFAKIVGSLVGFCLLGIISYGLIKFGIKLTKNM